MRLFKSTTSRQKDVERALSGVSDPVSGKPLTSSGRIDSLLVSPDGSVILALLGAPDTTEADERLRYQCEQVLSSVKGVKKVSIMLTAHTESQSAPSKPPSAPASRPSAPPQTQSMSLDVPGIASVIAIASAKGGVGKSSMAVNLAVTLAKRGLRVGLLDVDVFGPSVPTMTGTVEADPAGGGEKKLKPVEAHGLKLMSIGYVTDNDAPMIWRGPVVMSAIQQMLRDVDWGELDLLILDTPPGTGDVQLTLAQRMKLSGAVIVSTPQEVALADVRRGVNMFRKTNVPVLGLVENMAWFEDPISGNRSYVFGKGGASELAENLSVPLLGEVPLLQDVREGADAGTPAVLSSEATAKVFDAIADRLMSEMTGAQSTTAPEIVFD